MYAPLTALLLLGTPAQPPDKPAPDTKAEAAEASAFAKKRAAEYVVQIDKAKLKLEPEPVLRWTNHLGRRFYGDVYVWTLDGRPEVIASFNSIYTAKVEPATELQSLSLGRPVLSHNDKSAWEPAEPGIAFKPLPDAPKPADTAEKRLLQLRALAAQFAVTASYADTKDEELRLLRAPIFRYESAARGATDGGLFAFTKGTDPDAVLLIEARGKGDGLKWEYSFARLNGYCALKGKHKDAAVWAVERQSHAVNTDPKQTYFTLRN